MKLFSKLIISIAAICIANLSFANLKDTNKRNDTITLLPEQIQSVEINCTGPIRALDTSIRERHRPIVINSEEEFEKVFYNDCEVNVKVDFALKTLLYFPTVTGGSPTYLRTVKIIGNKVIYTVHIIQPSRTMTMQAEHNNNIIVIPKINWNSTVDFKTFETYLDKK